MMTNLMLMTLTSLATTALPDGWKIYTPDGGQCRIAFANEPKFAKVPFDTSAGTAEMHLYSDGDMNDEVSFALMWNDFPAVAGRDLSGELAQQALDKGRDGWVQSVQGKLGREKKLKIGRHVGREFSIRLEGGKWMRVRLFLADHRLFQIGVRGSEDVVFGATGDEFVGSFRLLMK